MAQEAPNLQSNDQQPQKGEKNKKPVLNWPWVQALDIKINMALLLGGFISFAVIVYNGSMAYADVTYKLTAIEEAMKKNTQQIGIITEKLHSLDKKLGEHIVLCGK